MDPHHAPSWQRIMTRPRDRMGSFSVPADEDPNADKFKDDDKHEYLFKVLVLGDSGVGKTSAVRRYVHRIFSAHYKATIGVDFSLKVLEWDADTRVRLQIWDTAGQERFGSMTRVYFKEAEGAVILYDLPRSHTREGALKWKNQVDTCVTNRLVGVEGPIPTVLIGNKADLRSVEPADLSTDEEALKETADAGAFIAGFRLSVKEATEKQTLLDVAFMTLVRKMIERRDASDRAKQAEEEEEEKKRIVDAQALGAAAEGSASSTTTTAASSSGCC